ncbi:FAD:protein FMN transferase [Fournierella sp.]|uniref:FAD:protein FMN transferase n=1 Tax=Allofournierella sp. TaxID=1940256 RepID=UPI0025B7F4BD|nr:FAD:protein FMN transferase [Fournierella sp.]
MVKRLLCAGCAAVLLAASLAGCGSPASSSVSVSQTASTSADPAMAGWEKYTASWYDVFDTVTTVIGYAPSEEEWDRQMDALHQDLAEYHQLYDIYNHYEGVTNLYDLNRSAAQRPVAVDQRIMDLLVESKEMYKTTSGKMNVAFGAVLSIWHDYREAGLNDPDSAQLPPMEQLTAASEHCSIDDLVLDEEAGTVYFADDQLQLDVGSVGKGYAVEMVARAAEERGLSSAILSVGGNVRTIGHKPDGSRWTAGIQDPWASAELAGQVVNDAPYLVSVYMEDMALVTSGDYQRFYEVDGKRYNHIIDPDTLMPADHFSAVAVLVPDSGLGDCLSTGLFCLSLEDGQALVESLDGVEAMWMTKDGSVVYSSGFGDSVKATLEGYEP